MAKPDLEKVARILQDEAQFSAEVAQTCMQKNKMARAKARQVIAAHFYERARRKLFRLIGAETDERMF